MVCGLARQNTTPIPHLHPQVGCVPSDSVSQSATVSICPLFLYLVWLLWIVSHHTFLGCQEISGTEDTRSTKIKKKLNLYCDLDLENNNLIITQSTPAYGDVPANYIWLQKDQQFSRYGRNSHIWSKEPSLWPWTWRQPTSLLAWHFGPPDVASLYQVW